MNTSPKTRSLIHTNSYLSTVPCIVEQYGLERAELSLGLFIGPENGGDIFLRNILQ
jgi:hypothetical protein